MIYQLSFFFFFNIREDKICIDGQELGVVMDGKECFDYRLDFCGWYFIQVI